MQRIEFGEFLIIGEIHSGIRAEELVRMDRVLRLGQAALLAPFAGFGDFEAHPTLCEKAAIYCARIATYQPLPDGNKRTGYDVMREFIERNGATFTHPAGGLMETAAVIEDVSTGAINENVFKGWVLHRIDKRPR